MSVDPCAVFRTEVHVITREDAARPFIDQPALSLIKHPSSGYDGTWLTCLHAALKGALDVQENDQDIDFPVAVVFFSDKGHTRLVGRLTGFDDERDTMHIKGGHRVFLDSVVALHI